jgi:hypothetical protein
MSGKVHGTNVHLIADENLGGVLREYVEVDRPAKEGDLIVVYDGSDIYEDITAGKPYPVHKTFKSIGGDDYIKFYDDVGDERVWSTPNEDYAVIEPTDIVHIDGARYRLVDRKAKVGDRIIIVDGKGWYRDKVGNIYEVIHSSKYGFEEDDDGRAYVEYEKNEYDEAIHYVRRENYRVLEPVEPAENELVTAEEGDPKSTLDLLANLARRVTELEWKLQTTQENYNKVFEKILDDIVTLDERTQPLVALVKAVKGDE